MPRRERRETNVSGFTDYEQYDATGLADLVRRRQVTPTELLARSSPFGSTSPASPR